MLKLKLCAAHMGQNTMSDLLSTMLYCQLPAKDYKFTKCEEYYQSFLFGFQHISTAQNCGSQIIGLKP